MSPKSERDTALLMVVVLMFLSMGQSEAQCPDGCYCFQDFTTCMGLTSFPVSLPVETTMLTMYNLEVPEIPAAAFQGLPYLSTLEIYSSTIKTISSGAFKGLVVDYFSFYQNTVDTIEPYAFDDIKDVGTFSVYFSTVNIIESYAFFNLQNIGDFGFFSMNISQIYPNAFQNFNEITNFQMYSNTIEKMHAGAIGNAQNVDSFEMYLNNFGSLGCNVVEPMIDSARQSAFYSNDAPCNCDLAWVVDNTRLQGHLYSNWCYFPNSYNRVYFNDVTLDMLGCARRSGASECQHQRIGAVTTDSYPVTETTETTDVKSAATETTDVESPATESTDVDSLSTETTDVETRTDSLFVVEKSPDSLPRDIATDYKPKDSESDTVLIDNSVCVDSRVMIVSDKALNDGPMRTASPLSRDITEQTAMRTDSRGETTIQGTASDDVHVVTSGPTRDDVIDSTAVSLARIPDKDVSETREKQPSMSRTTLSILLASSSADRGMSTEDLTTTKTEQSTTTTEPESTNNAMTPEVTSHISLNKSSKAKPSTTKTTSGAIKTQSEDIGAVPVVSHSRGYPAITSKHISDDVTSTVARQDTHGSSDVTSTVSAAVARNDKAVQNDVYYSEQDSGSSAHKSCYDIGITVSVLCLCLVNL
jgi:hypothetical protein